MVVEMLQPDSAPLWLDFFIWMAFGWQYILVGFVPAFYVAVVKLFGMPLLQRWQSEVVIMLYPNKAKFRKIDQQWDQYVVDGKGVYWPKNTMRPDSYETIRPKVAEMLEKNKLRYEELKLKKERTEKEEKEMNRLFKDQDKLAKRKLTTNPVNTLHLFYHSVNQEIYDLERRDTKINEVLHGNTDRKAVRLKKHGVWLMQNPKAHFHRHYIVVVNPDFTGYSLMPVKQRQQFGIGFWHSIGIRFTEVQEAEPPTQEGVEITEVNKTQQQIMLLPPISMGAVVQQIRMGQSYQNFSANKAYNLLFKRRAPLEANFPSWISGAMGKQEFMMIATVIGGIGAIIVFYMMFHGGGGGAAPSTGVHPLI